MRIREEAWMQKDAEMVKRE
jgi:hypothetical protein